MATRRQNPKGEGSRLRDELLAAAEELLVRHGSQSAVTIQSVCNAVGCTPPALYRHFEDKHQLVVAVCERLFERYRAAVRRAERRAISPRQRLDAIGHAYIRFALENPGVYRVLFMHGPDEQPSDNADVRDLAATASMFQHLRATVAEVAPSADAHRLAVQIWSMVHGLSSLAISKPDFPWPGSSALAFALRSADDNVDALLRAVATGESSSVSSPSPRRR
jgi:AcrR family transcriptional regulator